MVDGSNESLEHADQEYDPILRKGITLQNSFEKVDVAVVYLKCPLFLRKAAACIRESGGPFQLNIS